MNINSGIYFIISHLEISGELPFEILPGHTVRKARDSEIENINRIVKDTVINRLPIWIPYDGLYQKIPTESGGATFLKTSLPKECWKYWVIAYSGNNRRQLDIMKASLLLPFDFQFGSMMFSENDQHGDLLFCHHFPDHVVERYNDFEAVFKPPTKIDVKELKKIGKILNSIDALKHRNIEIYEHFEVAISRFREILTVSRKTDLIIVGLFALIEFLVTHKPRLHESLDSITHQLINKIVLLRKRYSRHIDATEYFSKAREEVIWKKLYAYRSSIAHGSVFQFTKEGAILNSKENVIEFLEENIKKLLLLLLEEPDLMFDIRSC
jgi:hypothetical protein